MLEARCRKKGIELKASESFNKNYKNIRKKKSQGEIMKKIEFLYQRLIKSKQKE
jgi:hypothetical protein